MFGKRSWGTPSPATHVCSGSCWKTLRELGFMRGRDSGAWRRGRAQTLPSSRVHCLLGPKKPLDVDTPRLGGVTVQRSSCWTPGRQREEVKLAAREGWMVSGPPGRLGGGAGAQRQVWGSGRAWPPPPGHRRIWGKQDKGALSLIWKANAAFTRE